MDRRRTKPKLQVNTLWPLALTLVLVTVQVVFPARVWVVLLWMVGGITGLAYYWARQLVDLVSVEREMRYGWVQVGDRLEERFTLRNGSWLPVLWGEVIDESDLPGYQAGRIASCGAQSVSRWATAQECTRRGLFTLGPWALKVGDPFGFFSVTFRHDETEAIAVYPPVVHLPDITLPRGLVSGASRARQRTTQATIDAAQTRYYQPQDPLRVIHWPSTAHRGTLIVRDPDTEISGDLWIVLDLDQHVQVGEGQESTEEYGVILAASLADRVLRQNRGVGLVAHGADLAFVPLGRGRGHMWRILHSLAVVKAGGAERLAEVLSGLQNNLGQGTTVLVITPSLDPRWVDALLPLTRWGIFPSVVLLDPASFEDPDLPSGVESIRELLARAAIPSYVIGQGYPFRYVEPLRRRGHWEFKTTPMGRAVAVKRPEEV